MRIYALAYLLSLSGFIYGQEFYILTETFHIESSGRIDDGFFRYMLPKDYPSRQQVLSIEYSDPPDGYRQEGDAHFAHWNAADFRNGDSIVVRTKLMLYPYDLLEAREHPSPIPPGDLSPYLEEDTHIPVSWKEIQKLAPGLRGSDPEQTARNIFDFVIEHLDYRSFAIQDRGARRALKKGEGDCTEYAELMITLCRANGIPARLVQGKTLTGRSKIVYHNWVELYFADRGWVPFDPTFADGENRSTNFERLTAHYVYTSFERFLYQYQWRYTGQRANMHIRHQTRYERPTNRIMDWAYRLYYSEKYSEAISSLDTLLSISPKDYNALVYKGLSHARLGEYEIARKHFQFALKCARDDFERGFVIANFGEFYALQGEAELTLSHLRKGMELGYSIHISYFDNNGLFDLIRDHPDFEKLREMADHQTIRNARVIKKVE